MHFGKYRGRGVSVVLLILHRHRYMMSAVLLGLDDLRAPLHQCVLIRLSTKLIGQSGKDPTTLEVGNPFDVISKAPVSLQVSRFD